MLYVEVTTQLFVFLFAQDHLGAHIGRQFERASGSSIAHTRLRKIRPNIGATLTAGGADEAHLGKGHGVTRRACRSIARCTVCARAARASSRRRAATFWSCSPAAVTSRFPSCLDKADKRFAADRAAEKVIEHKAKQKTGRKIAA
jgi:hypothetical protein